MRTLKPWMKTSKSVFFMIAVSVVYFSSSVGSGVVAHHHAIGLRAMTISVKVEVGRDEVIHGSRLRRYGSGADFALCKLPRIYAVWKNGIREVIIFLIISALSQHHDLSLGSRTIQYNYQSVSITPLLLWHKVKREHTRQPSPSSTQSISFTNVNPNFS